MEKTEMTEREKMLAGKIYDPSDPELVALRTTAHNLSKDFNNTYETDMEKREEILAKLLPNRGERVFLNGPIQFDYGIFTTIGDYTYANFNFLVLDCCPVTIGKNVFFGPNVSIVTPIHPLIAEERRQRFKEDGTIYDEEYAAPITIEDDCWICTGVTITGGVTIGKGSVIGAGSVVVKDIPEGVLAAGNPCKMIRKLTEEDRIHKKEGIW